MAQIMDDKTDVLVVEDDKAMSVLTCMVLQASGFAARPALDGGSGLREARSQVPHVILLDLMLPDMNGFEVCQELKRDEQTAHVPVIMLTALADEESRLRGIALGARAYLTKPYNPKQLVDLITKLAAEPALQRASA